MLELIIRYKYRIAYLACLAAALFLIFDPPLPFSPTTDTLFEFHFIKFLAAASLVGVGAYFRSKDIVREE